MLVVLRSNRGEPKEFANNKKLKKKGELTYATKDKTNILLWYDKRIVCFITTFMSFDPSILNNSAKVFEKYAMIENYDRNIGV